MNGNFCSWCLQIANPRTLEDRHIERNLLECSHCGKTIVKCRACNNYAKWGVIDVQKDGKTIKATLKHQFCAEHRHEIPNFETSHDKLREPSEYLSIYKFKAKNLSALAKIGGLSIVGAGILGPVGFYIAPSVGGALGVVLGYSGAVATNVGLATLGGGAVAAGGLGMAGGTALIAGFGSLLGGGIGAHICNTYMRSIQGFKIHKIRDGIEPAILTINGFLSQADESHSGWELTADTKFTNHAWYHVDWQSKNLAKLGVYASSYSSQAALGTILKNAAQSASKTAAKTLGPAAKLQQIIQLSTNPCMLL